MKSFKEFSFKKSRTTTPVQQSKPEDMAGGTQQNTAPAKRFANVHNVFKVRKSSGRAKVRNIHSPEAEKGLPEDQGTPAQNIRKHSQTFKTRKPSGRAKVRNVRNIHSPEAEKGLPEDQDTPEKKLAKVSNVLETRKPAHSRKVSNISKVSSPERKKAFLDEQGRLRIPLDADDKYRYWAGGQSVFDTLLELGASDKEIEAHIGPIRNPTNWKRWQEIKKERHGQNNLLPPL